jgi:hypothetical protein
MSESSNSLITVESRLGRIITTKTTLYELIEAINEVVRAGEERLIPLIVLHMIDSGKIKLSTSTDIS